MMRKISTLDDLCDIDYGTRIVRKRDGARGYPVYGGGGPTFSAGTYNREDCLVVARFGMSPACTRFVKGRFFLNDSGLTVTPKTEQLNQRFLDYQLIHLNNQIYGLGKGAAQRNLNVAAFRRLQLYVPPFAEQLLIIERLDKAFEVVDVAKRNIEISIERSRTLFSTYLNTVFETPGESWSHQPLESVASILSGFAFKSTDFSPNPGIKCIKITNVGIGDFVFESGGYLPDSSAAEYSHLMVRQGSIVMALTRTIIAGGLKVAIVPEEFDGALLNQRVAAIMPNEAYISRAFLFKYLATRMVLTYVRDRVNTLMQPNLSIRDLRSMPVPIPPKSKQYEIQIQLEELCEYTLRLASAYQRKMTALDELRASLLHAAFSRDLTAHGASAA